jgi:acetyltransferase-like isoleucine patch superfamily enzyme
MQNLIRHYYRTRINPHVELDLDVNVPLFLLKSLYYHLFRRRIFAHHNTVIRGIQNIESHGRLLIGTGYTGLFNGHDRTFLRINGKLITHGTVHIGKGSRVFVGKNATCTLTQCSITGHSNFNITHHLEIGPGSAIAWGCEFLDNDFHTLEYPGKKEKASGIVLGSHVWVGSHVTILKGVRIASNTVIAANSVVTHSCQEEHVLLAGNPAKVVRRDVTWR